MRKVATYGIEDKSTFEIRQKDLKISSTKIALEVEARSNSLQNSERIELVEVMFVPSHFYVETMRDPLQLLGSLRSPFSHLRHSNLMSHIEIRHVSWSSKDLVEENMGWVSVKLNRNLMHITRPQNKRKLLSIFASFGI